MATLAVDIGNTQFKAGIFLNDILVEVHTCINTEIEQIKQFLQHKNIDKIILSSVLKSNDEIVNILSNCAPIFILNHQSNLPFTNNYASPKTLGIDRIAGIAGALHFYPSKNILLIDAGTCITYDFVSDKKIYSGGSISPGINMRLKALHEYTGKLPLVPYFDMIESIGNDTKTSIMTGVHYGLAHEINGFINQYKQANDTLQIIITGGDAPKFAKHLKNIVFAQPNLLLYGLNNILKINV